MHNLICFRTNWSYLRDEFTVTSNLVPKIIRKPTGRAKVAEPIALGLSDQVEWMEFRGLTFVQGPLDFGRGGTFLEFLSNRPIDGVEPWLTRGGAAGDVFMSFLSFCLSGFVTP